MDRHLTWHRHADGDSRASLLGQKPAVIWLTGLSASGKSTIAQELDEMLLALGHPTYVLDGDNVRQGLNSDLGFSASDRAENVRRVGEVAKLMVDAGLFVLVPLISPFRADRDAVRERISEDQFIEVFVNTPVEDCEKRDPKGLYKKARQGEIKGFTGVSAPYEIPQNPEIIIHSHPSISAKHHAESILEYLKRGGYFTLTQRRVFREHNFPSYMFGGLFVSVLLGIAVFRGFRSWN